MYMQKLQNPTICTILLFLSQCSLPSVAQPINTNMLNDEFIRNIVKIAEHGELRDLNFIETIFSVKTRKSTITISPEIGEINNIPVVDAFSIKLSGLDLLGLDYRYWIHTQDSYIKFGKHFNPIIVNLDFFNIRTIACVSLHSLEYTYNLNNVSVSPGLNSPYTRSFGIVTYSGSKYITQIVLFGKDSEYGCADRLLIAQSTL